MYSNLVVAAAAAELSMMSPVSAAPAPHPAPYYWDITGLSVDCTTAGCSYLFNIAGDKDNNTPAFNAQCTARVGPSDTTYRTCDLGLNADGSPLVTEVRAYFKLDGSNYYQSELFVQVIYPDVTGGPYDVELTGSDKATYAAYKAKQDFRLFPTQTSAMA